MSSTSPAPSPAMSAEEITRASKSNLALAFVALPADRRRDMAIFYSFCRVVDDLADESTASVEERQRALDVWRASLSNPVNDESPLAPQVRELIARRGLNVEDLVEIIRGCEMDLRATEYETWEDLRLYCHRVASCVGLVSLGIFGAKAPEARTYAIELGLALQVTNIIRDVGHDFREMGRVYLPREDMARFGYNTEALAAGRHDQAFQKLIEFEAERAEDYYRRACAAYPKSDRRALVAAEIMRRVYHGLLHKMRRDGFRVLSKKYRLTRWQKLACVVSGMVRSL